MVDTWFRTQLDYHFWATKLILSTIETLTQEQYERFLGSSFSSIHATVAHLLSIEAMWLGRMTSTVRPVVTTEEIRTVAAARKRWCALEDEYRVALGSLEEGRWAQTLRVRNGTGEESVHTYAEILQHVVNHGAYHRGQIVTMLRQMGIVPPATDLIVYYLERNPYLTEKLSRT